jgi:DNA-binding IclR family transcriptional regulator
LSIPSERTLAPPTPAYRNQAAQRVLQVLSAFNGAGTRGVTELAQALGMSKNMVHRALSTLLDEGYVARDASGLRYQLGTRVLALGEGDPGEFDMISLCRPFLATVHALTRESVYLSIIVGTSRVTIDEILPPGPRVLRSLRGSPVALHCTKMSRVLLAHLSDSEIAAYLDSARPLKRQMPFPDPQSETRDGVLEDVRAIRTMGEVLWRNPHLSSAAYAIFPLLDETQRPHAILTVGGPRERFDIARISGLLPAMQSALQPLREHLKLLPAPSPSWMTP